MFIKLGDIVSRKAKKKNSLAEPHYEPINMKKLMCLDYNLSSSCRELIISEKKTHLILE